MARRAILIKLAVGLALLAGSAGADGDVPRVKPRPIGWAVDAARSGDWDAASRLAAKSGAVAQDLVEWMRLRAGQGTYAEVTRFLERRSDWPGLPLLRRESEEIIAAESNDRIVAFFENLPPRTATGVLAYARALATKGQRAKADELVLNAWLSMSLSQADQNRFWAAHKPLLQNQIDARLNMMLWKRWRDNARQLLPLASKDHAALGRARIGLQQRVKNVDALIEAVPKALRNDPGLTHDRFEWRVRKGRWEDAKALLLESSASATTLGEPTFWANRRRALARDEMRDGKATRAYEMASQHFLTTGSHYADLEWLSGYIALTWLNDAELALQHFRNHDAAVKSPISKGRAGYWQGRALTALGRIAEADQAFTKGAAYQTSFYGLLAAEAAGLPFDVGLNDVPSEHWRGSALEQDSLFVAGRLLAADNERNLAEMFWTHLAEQLGEHDAALLGQAAIDLGEPHLAVMIGKAVARRGATVPVPYYPLHPLAQSDLPVPAELSLAIARRESEFDPVVVSGVGARGLMQLMPATGKEVAARLGLAGEHTNARLTEDPVYNARLGSKYLAELSAQFGGNIVMMSAGYNAGPGRPRRWMDLYGDPRGRDDTDRMIRWIENIPFRETRNYVMRVSESLPIYRARLGQEPLPVPFSRELMSVTR